MPTEKKKIPKAGETRNDMPRTSAFDVRPAERERRNVETLGNNIFGNYPTPRDTDIHLPGDIELKPEYDIYSEQNYSDDLPRNWRSDDPRQKEYLRTGKIPVKKSSMRAPSTTERVGDFLRSVFGSVAEQPLGQIADALGVTDFTGLAEPRSSEELNLGIMPGPPGSGFLTPKPKSVGTFSREGMLNRKNIYRPSKREIDLEYESINNPEATRVAQKYGIDVAPTGEVDWFGPTHSNLAEAELDEIALRRAAAMGTEPRRLGQPNAIATTEIDHFAPTLRFAPNRKR